MDGPEGAVVMTNTLAAVAAIGAAAGFVATGVGLIIMQAAGLPLDYAHYAIVVAAAATALYAVHRLKRAAAFLDAVR